MMRSLLLLLVLGSAMLGHGQRDSAEVRAAFKVVLNFDARRTWVNDASVRFNGLRLGAQRGRDLVALGLYISVLNQAPESPYFAQTLQHWEQGRFIRFHGLAHWLGWLWPYGALVYLLAQLGRRSEET